MDDSSVWDVPSFGEFLRDNRTPTRSATSRTDALDFAHPVDAKIIGLLDSPVVTSAVAKLIELSMEADYGGMISSGLRIDNRDNELSDIVRHCAETLHIKLPYTFISSGVVGLNAFTIGTDEEVYIALSSLLTKLFTKKEQVFVVGHECGHVALGHVMFHSVGKVAGNFSSLVPILGPLVYKTVSLPLSAWSRRSEISADRAGLLCCGELETALRALLHLEAGFESVDDFDVDEYIRDSGRWMRRSQIGFLSEMQMEHPLIYKRLEALKIFAASEKYYRLSGKPQPQGEYLLSDAELDRRVEQIIKVFEG